MWKSLLNYLAIADKVFKTRRCLLFRGFTLSVLFFGFLYLILLFFVFTCLFQRRIPTNACIIYFSIKRWSDSKTLKIKIAFWSWRKGDQLNIVTEVVWLISWWPEQLFREFQYSHFRCGSPAELIRFHRQPLWIFFLFVSLFCWWLCKCKSIWLFSK